MLQTYSFLQMDEVGQTALLPIDLSERTVISQNFYEQLVKVSIQYNSMSYGSVEKIMTPVRNFSIIIHFFFYVLVTNVSN